MIFRLLAAAVLMTALVQVAAAAGAQAPNSAAVAQQNAQPARTSPRATTPPVIPAQPYASRPATARPYAPRASAAPQQTPPLSTQQPAQQVPSGPESTSCATGNCDEWPASIKVANPPPANTPLLPPYERIILWAALLVLIILGYVAILLALSTLKKIERQTRAGEEAATAAAESARAALMHSQAIVNAERPWILVTTEPSPGVANGFAIIAANRGRTPARIIAMPHRIEFAENESRLPEVPEYQQTTASNAAPFLPVVLLPGEFAQIATFCRDDVKELSASQEQFTRIENWEERIFLHGRVTYRDLLSPADQQIHESVWCFWYIHGHQNSGMVPAGSPNYNRHT